MSTAVDPTNNPNAPVQTDWFGQVTKNLLSLVQGGAQVYSTINNKTNGAAANTANQQATIQPAGVVGVMDKPVILGLNQTQLLWIAGGLTAVLVVSIVLRNK